MIEFDEGKYKNFLRNNNSRPPQNRIPIPSTRQEGLELRLLSSRVFSLPPVQSRAPSLVGSKLKSSNLKKIIIGVALSNVGPLKTTIEVVQSMTSVAKHLGLVNSDTGIKSSMAGAVPSAAIRNDSVLPLSNK